MRGRRIAIFGLGRSGLAIGKAAIALGARPHVYDEQTEQNLTKHEMLEEARAIALPVTLGWDGTFQNADLLVTNPAVDMRHPKLRAAVEAGIEVISEVEFAYRISKAPIVAITGTNGKTTTTVMTYLCLRAAGKDAVLCGNIFGSGYDEVPLTEAACKSDEDQVLVAEISSFQLEWVSKFRPVSAGVTNITPDHQNRYTGFEQYAETKRRIYAAQGPDCYAVVCADDGEAEHVPNGPRILTFGKDGRDAQVVPAGIRVFERLISNGELPFREAHNRVNASMAALLAYGALRHEGVAHEEALDRLLPGLREFSGIAHRMQLVGECCGIKIVNNSMCTNPAALVASLESLDRPAHILIGGVNKHLDFAPARALIDASSHSAYLYGMAAPELSEMLGERWPTYSTMQDAFVEAVKNAKGGEVILLAPGCASNDQFRDFRERGNVFMSLAKEWLRTCSAH